MIDEKNLNPEVKPEIDKHISEEKFKTIALCNYLIQPNNDVLFLDTETTGFFGDSEIVELCVCDSQGNTLIDQMFKPSVKMDPAASEISGITDEMLADKPSFSQFADQITQMFEGKTLVGWNTSFDLRLLKQTFKASGIEKDFQKENLWLDAQKISQSYFNTKIKLKQAEVMECLKFDHIENHRAIDDVVDMMRVLAILANKDNVGIIDDIAKYISDNKKEAIEVERKYGTTGVSTGGGRKPSFVKYLENYLQTKDVNQTSKALGVSVTTVKVNLMKAMSHGEMAYEKLTRQLTPIQETEAVRCLNNLGYTDNKEIFTKFSTECGGYNYQTYTNAARAVGLNIEDLYDIALRLQMSANGTFSKQI